MAAPLGPEEVTLPHSDPVPAAQMELAKPWIEVGHDNEPEKKKNWKKFIGFKPRLTFRLNVVLTPAQQFVISTLLINLAYVAV